MADRPKVKAQYDGAKGCFAIQGRSRIIRSAWNTPYPSSICRQHDGFADEAWQ